MAIHNDNGINNEWENVVSDDEGTMSQYGTLIVEGDEEEEEDSELDATGVDVSMATFRKIASKMTVDSPSDASYKNDMELEESSLLFGSITAYTKQKKKKIMVGVAVAIFLMLVIAGVTAWNRHWQDHVSMKQELARVQQELDEKSKNCYGFDKQEDEDWKLADNCYIHAKLGQCARKRVEDLNDVATSAWDGIEAAWNAASSWPFDGDSDNEDGHEHEPKMNSMHHFFSETAYAFAQTVTAVANDVTKTTQAVTHGVAKGVADFVDEVSANVDEQLQRIIEATRDSVEDGTAYTRLEM